MPNKLHVVSGVLDPLTEQNFQEFQKKTGTSTSEAIRLLINAGIAHFNGTTPDLARLAYQDAFTRVKKRLTVVSAGKIRESMEEILKEEK